MTLHALLETLINHTVFRTEQERHEALDLLDAHVERAEPPGPNSIARTDWRPKIATLPSGLPVPTGMTSAQADELIALFKAAQNPPDIASPPVPRNVLKGENDILPEDAPLEVTTEAPPPTVTPAADMPSIEPVSPSDVPDGVT
jgi:hypothetical protein